METLNAIGAALAALWKATLEGAQAFGPAVKSAVLVGAGRLWQALASSLVESRTVLQQYKDIVDAERKNDQRPVGGAAGRMQHGSWQRKPPAQ